MGKLFLIIGTKGQYVKMAPVMLELDRRGIPYRLIHANQHPRITREISRTFGLREPDAELFSIDRDIATTAEAIRWLSRNLYGLITGNIATHLGMNEGRKAGSNGDIMIIHGDAPPALLALVAAKRFGLRVAHVESGERTHNLLQPFPEEIIRKLVDRFSDILFAGSQAALANLRNEKVKGEVVDIGINTLLDAVRYVLNHQGGFSPHSEGEYALIYFHRFESVNSYSRLKFLLDIINRGLGNERLLMILHDSTRHNLQRMGLLGSLQKLEERGHLTILPLLPYHQFISLLSGARFLVTDGGGPQRESHLLGVPCLILREHVEQEGFENVCVAGFEREKMRGFLADPECFRIAGGVERFGHLQPSKAVVDRLEREI